MVYILLTILTIIIISTIWIIQGYNQLVRLHAVVQEAWSGVEVQLKRRYDLIPNLVATVKQYTTHEQQILENVTRLRSQSMNADNVEQKSSAEADLNSALQRLFAVSENYPELQANDNFIQLQNQLASIEEEIQLARRYYNGTVRNYNIIVRSFPSRLIAMMFGYEPETYFKLESTEEQHAPNINT